MKVKQKLLGTSNEIQMKAIKLNAYSKLLPMKKF